ncbi:MAG TPA: sugar kinase [Parvularculaceae bacterium]|nr:sugar kinase [Parvularculaceae bacterium]
MSVFVFGEGMLELSAVRDGSARVAYGGDALNTAVYLARLGVAPQFVTALGDDPYSAWLKSEWRAEGLKLDHCLTVKGGKPGLYAISLDDRGERSFTYWRNDSAARAFFDCAQAASAIEAMTGASLLYLTGITLSIFAPAHHARIFSIMEAAAAAGGKIAFDVNFRPRGWSDANDARRAVRAALDRSTIAFSSVEDWTLLFGAAGAEEIVSRIGLKRQSEIVVKEGARGCFFAAAGERGWVAPEEVRAPLDTTGAGDNFNAAYFAARLRGAAPREACAAGNRLAAETIMHAGAIKARIA